MIDIQSFTWPLVHLDNTPGRHHLCTIHNTVSTLFLSACLSVHHLFRYHARYLYCMTTFGHRLAALFVDTQSISYPAVCITSWRVSSGIYFLALKFWV